MADRLPSYAQAARGNEVPPPYEPSGRPQRRNSYRGSDPERTRVITFPVQIEINTRRPGHTRVRTEQHNQEVTIHRKLSFEDFQTQLRIKHVHYNDNRSFTWSTWLRYANGQRKQVRSDSWTEILSEVLSLGEEVGGLRLGGFPSGFVSQSNAMGDELYAELKEAMAKNHMGWSVEQWTQYLLSRGYRFKVGEIRENCEAKEEEVEGGERREGGHRAHRHGHRQGDGQQQQHGGGLRSRLERLMHGRGDARGQGRGL